MASQPMGLAAIADFFAEGRDVVLLGWIWKSVILFSVLFPVVRVPFGKMKSTDVNPLLGWLNCCRINQRLAWFLMELPAFAVPTFLVLNYGGKYVGEANPNVVLLSMFLLHYTQRVFVYSLFILKNGSPSPIAVHLSGFFFCLVNGYQQGRSLTNFTHYDLSWFYDPRFVVGSFLFLLGMAINIQSDLLLRSLRKPGETGYKIPTGGLFDYVSGANYFGEIVEWTGYAIACWNPAAVSFAIFVASFLGSRALQYHRFYQKKFDDYPRERKALIPFLL